MTRCFIDLSDGARRAFHREGCESASPEAALRAATRREPLRGERRAVPIKLRDEHGRHLFHASLTLIARWLP